MPLAVDHLKKVNLELRTDTVTAPFEFICGAASEGFCPFEYELLEKVPGDQFKLSIPWTKAGSTFAHLYTPFCMTLQLPNPPETLDLIVSIVSVSDPEPREVVRAMAQATEKNGCGGDCSCGCGSH